MGEQKLIEEREREREMANEKDTGGRKREWFEKLAQTSKQQTEDALLHFFIFLLSPKIKKKEREKRKEENGKKRKYIYALLAIAARFLAENETKAFIHLCEKRERSAKKVERSRKRGNE